MLKEVCKRKIIIISIAILAVCSIGYIVFKNQEIGIKASAKIIGTEMSESEWNELLSKGGNIDVKDSNKMIFRNIKSFGEKTTKIIQLNGTTFPKKIKSIEKYVIIATPDETNPYAIICPSMSACTKKGSSMLAKCISEAKRQYGTDFSHSTTEADDTYDWNFDNNVSYHVSTHIYGSETSGGCYFMATYYQK